MRKISLLLGILLLGACSSEPRYLDNRTVKDSNGCAFMVKHTIGDVAFLRFIPQESNTAFCRFPLY